MYSRIEVDISGVPGIGKTLSAKKVFDDISKTINKEKVKIVQLNAMELKHPTDIYKNLYLGLSGMPNDKRRSKLSPHSALVTLDGIFRKN
jgi:Cdc6-like AAA superfamily ATPase